MARVWPRPPSQRARIVFDACGRALHEDQRNRLADRPRVPPSDGALEGLNDDERRFVKDLLADKLKGSVVDLVTARYGPIVREPEPSEPELAEQAELIAIDVERRRRRQELPNER